MTKKEKKLAHHALSKKKKKKQPPPPQGTVPKDSVAVDPTTSIAVAAGLGDDDAVETTAAPLNRAGLRNNLTSTFAKDSDESVAARKEDASRPLDLSKRRQPLTSVPHAYSWLEFPRRPPWTLDLSKQELEANEETLFAAWLKNIHSDYKLEELSPFEHNLQVWRQLWRVLERSQVILLVVDIRNPLLYLPSCFYQYIVQECHMPLVVALTKCDLVSQAFVDRWMAYLRMAYPGARFVPTYGKARPTEGQGGVRARRKLLSGKATKQQIQELQKKADNVLYQCLNALREFNSTTTRSITSEPPDEEESSGNVTRNTAIPTIGLVGCPNTGKSSLLNQIMGQHVVSVSRTVGHTKHFQTHYLRRPADSALGRQFGVNSTTDDDDDDDDNDQVVVAQLCDSPGLIFPLAWNTEGDNQVSCSPRCLFEMSGLYRIAQIREPFSAVRFAAEHLPMERLYNIKLDPDDYGEEWTPYAMCGALADAKGYTMARGGGAPDVHRAGLEIITNIVDGIVLLAWEPPPLSPSAAGLNKDIKSGQQGESPTAGLPGVAEHDEEDSLDSSASAN